MKTRTVTEMTEADVAAIVEQMLATILPARDQAIADAVAVKVRAEYDELVHALMELVGVKTELLEVEAAVKRR